MSWLELVKLGMGGAAEKLAAAQRSRKKKQDQATPRMATSEATLQRTGSHIRKDLGKFAYRWHQSGTSARWDPHMP